MTVTPALQAFWDQERRQIIEHIRRYGVHLTYVSDQLGGQCACCRYLEAMGADPGPEPEPSGPAFCYTTGLHGMGHPELLVFDRGQAESMVLLNTLTRQIIQGSGDLLPGEEVWVGHRRMLVEEVPNPGEIVLDANAFYERPPGLSVPVLQLTWADDEGRFPWEEGHVPGDWEQPRPGTFSAREAS